MKQVNGLWLRQGFFVLGDEGLMPAVRVELEKSLDLSPGSLHIALYPVRAKWKHTYWWREGHIEFAEAQFVAQIAKDYPVLSIGIGIEKGFEDAKATTKREELMDRTSWDWPRLGDHIDELLSDEVRAVADALRAPVNLRVSSKSVFEDDRHGWKTRAFSFLEDAWYERYVGRVEIPTIADYLRELDQQKDTWAIVHFAQDLGPAEAEGLLPSDLASTLMAFNGMRQRLRGSPTPGAAAT